MSFYLGDAGELLREWKGPKFATIVTSPPYFGCRDYLSQEKNELGVHHTGDLQLGHESTPFEYARNLAGKFGEASNSHYLKDEGLLWIVIGDSFARKTYRDDHYPMICTGEAIGINGLLIFEMRLRGWRLHQEVIWFKPSVPPSGAVQKRCNPCHEYVLVFAKNQNPKWDSKSIREVGKTAAGTVMPPVGGRKYGKYEKQLISDGKKCRQDVWTICPSRDRSEHVAPYPEEIPRIAILANSDPGDYILDTFAGTRTTERVAQELGRLGVSFDIIDFAVKSSSSPSSKRKAIDEKDE